jgi:thiol-disulfide isomerase/thioredoxin
MVMAVFSAGLLAASTLAAELGDPAPPLQIGKWIKGKPVDLSAGKGKNVYMVEFWATWCGPCKVSIPHLTELQAKYKDKGVVLVSISDEPPTIVEPFVEERGEKMGYTIACDDENKTGEAYMKAFDQQGIPTAFIIDKGGKIVWVGNPLTDHPDEAVEQVLAGTYDLAAAKKKFKEEQDLMRRMMAAQKSMTEYFELASSGEDAAKAAELGNRIVSENVKNAQLLNFFAWTLLTSDEIEDAKRDLKLGMRAAQAAYDACDGKDPAIVDTYARALFETGKVAEAIKYQKQAIELCTIDEMRADLEKTLKEYQSKLH